MARDAALAKRLADGFETFGQKLCVNFVRLRFNLDSDRERRSKKSVAISPGPKRKGLEIPRPNSLDIKLHDILVFEQHEDLIEARCGYSFRKTG